MSCSSEANLEKNVLPEDPWGIRCALLLCSSLFACNGKRKSNCMIWKLTLVGRAYASFLQSCDISLLVEKNPDEQGLTAYWNHTDQSCHQDFNIHTLQFFPPSFFQRSVNIYCIAQYKQSKQERSQDGCHCLTLLEKISEVVLIHKNIFRYMIGH